MTDPSQYFKGRTVQEQMNEVIGYVDTRSAEVATAAIANDVAQVHQDKLDADGYAQAAAASASAAAGTLANAVKKTGESSQSIAGDIAVAGDLSAGGDLGVTGDAAVTGDLSVSGTATVPTPVNNTDAANKKYVDDQDALLIPITDINNYAVGLTGPQDVAGLKAFEGGPDSMNQTSLFFKTSVATAANTTGGIFKLVFTAQNGDPLAYIRFNNSITPGKRGVQIAVYKGDGTVEQSTLKEVTI